MFNFTHLVLNVTKDHETCARWCQENGLIRSNRICDLCYDDMKKKLDPFLTFVDAIKAVYNPYEN